MGGNFNSRPGDFDLLGNNTTWIYCTNKDVVTNKRDSTYFCGPCNVGNMKPVIDNDFTFRSNGKSQNDLCLMKMVSIFVSLREIITTMQAKPRVPLI